MRFETDLPNETWQTDMCHWRLAGGAGAEILSFIDDCSRYALSVTAHRSVGVSAVVDAFRETAAHYGIPASVLIANNLDIRILNPATGELLRQLTLDPNRDYQPQPRT